MTTLEKDLLGLLRQWIEHAKKGNQDIKQLLEVSQHTLATRPAPMVFTTATQRMEADRLRAAGKTWEETGEALGLDGTCLRKSMARYGYKPHGRHKKTASMEQ
jgi:hypothetical protein